MFSSARDIVARNVLDSPSLQVLKSRADVLLRDLQLLRARLFGLSSTGTCVTLQESSRALPQPPTSRRKLPALFPWPSRSQAPHRCHADSLAKGRPAGEACGQAVRGATGRTTVQHQPPPWLACGRAPPAIAGQCPGTAQAVIKRGRTLVSTAKVKG